MSLLKIRHLKVEFPGNTGEAVRDFSLEIAAGEIVGLMGESGSGKSTAMKALLGLVPEAELSWQELCFNGRNILPPGKTDHGAARRQYRRQMEQMRGREIGMVFQNPGLYLNSAVKIGRQMTETILTHRNLSRPEAKARATHFLDLAGIRYPEQRFHQYPYELSGGMQQRVAIAMALSAEPKLLIADEVTASLDATVQGQILDLLKRIAAETDTAVLFVSHDLGAVLSICNRILVMKGGKVVENETAQSVFYEPQHPYTRELIRKAEKLQKYYQPPAVDQELIRFEAVSKHYDQHNFWQQREKTEAVKGVSFTIKAGETFGLIGESGSGKTTLGKLAAGLLHPDWGKIYLADQEMGSGTAVQLIFQNPKTSFNPHFTMGQILAEPLLLNGYLKPEGIAASIDEMLVRVGLSTADREKYPHQFSGGQLQRIAIARALITRPRAVVCDEAVSALDLSIQAQILELLKEIQKEEGLAYLFISHDLQVVKNISRRVGVMYQGTLVETGFTKDISEEPWHPYTKELLAGAVIADYKKARKRKHLPVKESLETDLKGCSYAGRCSYAMECCRQEEPESYHFGTRTVACFLYSEEHSGKRSRDYKMTVQI